MLGNISRLLTLQQLILHQTQVSLWKIERKKGPMDHNDVQSEMDFFP